jgi:hypothetical protein
MAPAAVIAASLPRDATGGSSSPLPPLTARSGEAPDSDPAGSRVSGSGKPLVSGKKGAATTPTIKNSPTIVAAEPKPPSPTISVPAINGPEAEIQRGALKQTATAVLRIRVGNSSGSQIGAQDQMPPLKNPKTLTATPPRRFLLSLSRWHWQRGFSRGPNVSQCLAKV